ncbi:MAG: hypothetical protein K2Q18_05365, partial [Bdellovibrionales bacterium]|nr:hypothetical protein [Bdellovibrionales bacterium]
FKTALNKNLRDGLKKSNSNAGQMLGSIYGSSGAISSSTADASKPTTISPNKVKSNGGPGVINLQGSTPAMNAGLEGLNGDTTLADDKAAADLASSSAQALNDFELKNSDITSDTSTSLFELISNRYQKSGYPRLFKIKEPAPAPVTK